MNKRWTIGKIKEFVEKNSLWLQKALERAGEKKDIRSRSTKEVFTEDSEERQQKQPIFF